MSSDPSEAPPTAALDLGRAARAGRGWSSVAVRIAVGLAVLTVTVLGVYTAAVLQLSRTALDDRTAQDVAESWARTQAQIAASALSVEDAELDAEIALPAGVGLEAGTLVALVPQAGDASESTAPEDAEAGALGAGALGQAASSSEPLPSERERARIAQELRGFVLDPSGGQRELTEAERGELARLLAGAPETSPAPASLSTDAYLVHWDPVTLAGAADRPERVLAVGLPVGAQEEMQGFASAMAVVLIGAVMLTLSAGAWLWITRSLSGLRTVAQQARSVAALPLGSQPVSLDEHRVPDEVVGRSDEAAVVGLALNTLLASVEDAMERREQTQRRLQQFVADASHELRTPLASMRGYTEMIALTEPLSERGRENLARVSAQTERMSALVEDLLLLARLEPREGETGALQHLRRVDVSEVVVEALEDARVAGPDHVWRLELDDDALGRDLTVLGDTPQLRRVVENLLSNARKHTPAGTVVTARIEAAPEGEDGPQDVVVTVHDDGPGIPPELMDRIFDRFVRGSAAREPREGSTGLGLPIAQAVARTHGGDLVVHSEPGSTRLVLTLPLAA